MGNVNSESPRTAGAVADAVRIVDSPPHERYELWVRDDLVGILGYRRDSAGPYGDVLTLLHTVDGLGPLLSLDPAGWAQADDMAAEIASGSWITETSGLDEMNLAVTAAAVRTALRR